MADSPALRDGWLPYEKVYGRDHTVVGTVLVWPLLDRGPLGRPTDIIVYLPPSLGLDGPGWRDGRRYPTLYFHDGQNVFDERTSYAGEWRADETLELLSAEDCEAIVVAIPNDGNSRMDEYNPWRSRDPFGGRKLMGGRGDEYLEWIVGTIKPLVDRTFPTSTERESTGIAGSSMGGLISLYGLVAQPDVFGMAVAMSPSIAWHDRALIGLIEKGKLPPARIHIDMGTHEWPGAVEELRTLRDALTGRGWKEGRDLNYVEERNARHNEKAWAGRLPDALRFVLRPLSSR